MPHKHSLLQIECTKIDPPTNPQPTIGDFDGSDLTIEGITAGGLDVTISIDRGDTYRSRHRVNKVVKELFDLEKLDGDVIIHLCV